MKRFSLVIAILLASQFIFAQGASKIVSEREALSYGMNYIKAQFPTRANARVSSYELLKSEETGKDCYHVFNFENGGFVIVCADRRGTPILGYSDEGSFVFDEVAPATQGWLNQYMQQLDIIEAKNIEVSDENVAAWNKRSNRAYVKTVGPLLTTKWNQSYPYNMLCPAHQLGDHGHTYTGCVATAMAQVMKYWNYPQSGTGKISYFWGQWDTINLAETVYDWDNMPNQYFNWTDEQKTAVATLMLHCGVSINMDYGYDGSGTQTEYTVDALRYNFGYRNGVNYKLRDNGNPNEDEFEHYYENDTIWTRYLMEDLDLHRPIIYSGHPTSGAGHAWVCDGYRIDDQGNRTFSMNWGWGGTGNGWFSVDNLNTHAGIDDASNNFKYGQGVVLNIAVPDMDIAPFCMQQETNVYEEEHWTINDGSYANFYKKNTDCDWLIKVKDYATDTIMCFFNYFELEAGDELKIYAGEDANGTLLYTFYDGNEPVDTIWHLGTPLYLHFTTDGENQARGWEMRYEALRYPFTVTSSIVGTGGQISPEGATRVMKESNLTITMTPDPGMRVTEFKVDGSLIVKNTLADETIGYTFTNIKANHTIEIQFGPASANEEEMSGIEIYPNPNNGKFTVNFGEQNVLSYTIYDMSGRIIEENNVNGNSYDFDLNLSAGTYFMRLIADDKVATHKITIE